MRFKRMPAGKYKKLSEKLHRVIARIRDYAKSIEDTEVASYTDRILRCGEKRRIPNPTYYCEAVHFCLGCASARIYKYTKQVLKYLEEKKAKNLYTFLRNEYIEITAPEEIPSAVEQCLKRMEYLHRAVGPISEGVVQKITLHRERKRIYVRLTTLLFFRRKRVRTGIRCWANHIEYSATNYADMDYFRKLNSDEETLGIMEFIFQCRVDTLSSIPTPYTYTFLRTIKGKKRWTAGGKIFYGTSDFNRTKYEINQR